MVFNSIALAENFHGECEKRDEKVTADHDEVVLPESLAVDAELHALNFWGQGIEIRDLLFIVCFGILASGSLFTDNVRRNTTTNQRTCFYLLGSCLFFLFFFRSVFRPTDHNDSNEHNRGKAIA